MVILHVAYLKDLECSGVGVVVPQHIISQQDMCTVGFINLTNIVIPKIKNQIVYDRHFEITKLPSPFNKPDLVVIHELYYPDYLKIYKNLMINGIDYIIVPHGGLTKKAQRIKWLKKRVANFVLFNSFFKSAAGYHFLSNEECLESNHYCKPFLVCENGVNLPDKKQAFFDTPVSLTFIGRLSIFHKGLDLLIESVEKLKDNYKDKMFLNIFGPVSKDYYRLRKELVNNDICCVAINGAVSGPEKQSILAKTTYFIQTSRFEGMPMGILEALALGIPVIITRGTNLTKYVAEYHAGFCAENDSNSIQDSLYKALDVSLEEYQLMSDNARKLIEDNFEWNIISRKTLDGYSRLLKSNNKGE